MRNYVCLLLLGTLLNSCSSIDGGSADAIVPLKKRLGDYRVVQVTLFSESIGVGPHLSYLRSQLDKNIRPLFPKVRWGESNRLLARQSKILEIRLSVVKYQDPQLAADQLARFELKGYLQELPSGESIGSFKAIGQTQFVDKKNKNEKAMRLVSTFVGNFLRDSR